MDLANAAHDLVDTCGSSFLLEDVKGHYVKGRDISPEKDHLVVWFWQLAAFIVFELDKFASIRIPGSKKERPPLPNLKHLSGSSDHSSAFSETRENIPKPLSENEVLKLFENMMEDMNLNEDKKAPLREKDFSIKKEMVMQYINTASKTVSKAVRLKNNAATCSVENNAFV
ncbi:hypothetical protein NN561_011498 [Cricetulus griseus]